MIDYGYQLYNTASPGRLKKHESIYRIGIRIYTSPVKSLHLEAY